MTITIDFYRVDEPSSASLDFVFQQISSTPVEERTRKVWKEYGNVNEIELRDGIWFGTITKIRMNAIPQKARLDGSVEDFSLAEDEGVGERSSFLYDPSQNSKTLVMQYNHYGIKSGALREYLSNFIQRAEFELPPYLTTDALQRMTRQNIIRTLQVSFAAPSNVQIFDNSDEATSAMIKFLRELDGGKANIEIKAERARGETLLPRGIRRLIESMLANREYVSALRVTGREQDESPLLPIDLLHDRMIETNPFNPTRRNRLFPKQMYIFLEDAYNKRRAEIQAQNVAGRD
ncbi:DUF6731 family protein [Ferroacidibacillus organovorans]|uniref:Uncharacterized protein n=1 Tax=Ferroacidibacillus organovorans TaxID=1765683 RepID=A0A117SXQ1_9BACL|nr:DUF6731 family protein [Ferroacidibacillus organovorans]KUO95644.1 hypothetical protein ATW55_15310 [Ferroacidibacillus organovorans]KUO96496.1 hypothetical protein ATW55_14670 [Ferroacidibacillus organovorans]